MCCVMPPASVSTTDVSRIASSSVVLPWSTWPMIVTTGGRSARSSSASSYVSGSSSSSAACLIVISRFSSVAISSTSSSDERLRGRAHDAEVHEDLDQIRHRHAERLREILDGRSGGDGDRPGRRGCRRLRLADDRSVAPLARIGTRPAGGGVDDDAPLATAAASCPLSGAQRAVRSVSSGCRQPLASSV